MKQALTWKLLAREWRSGELGILLMALVLAVSVVVGVSSFVTRLQSALLSESARFLAADMVVVSRSPIPEPWVMAAREQQLQPTEVVGFPSMAVADIDHMALSSIKAVSPGTRCGVSCCGLRSPMVRSVIRGPFPRRARSGWPQDCFHY